MVLAVESFEVIILLSLVLLLDEIFISKGLFL